MDFVWFLQGVSELNCGRKPRLPMAETLSFIHCDFPIGSVAWAPTLQIIPIAHWSSASQFFQSGVVLPDDGQSGSVSLQHAVEINRLAVCRIARTALTEYLQAAFARPNPKIRPL